MGYVNQSSIKDWMVRVADKFELPSALAEATAAKFGLYDENYNIPKWVWQSAETYHGLFGAPVTQYLPQSGTELA